MTKAFGQEHQHQLAIGIEQLGLIVSEQQQLQMLDYLALLLKWNKTHNLTAVSDPEQMVLLHLLDSLSILPHITGPQVLDVGSGAGLPGVVIAIMRPDIQVFSIDARNKKIQFQTLAAMQLGLSNFTAIHSRVEDYQSPVAFAQIVSRAFASLSDFVELTEHLLAERGLWLAMKGQYPKKEIAELDVSKVRVSDVGELQVPGLGAQRHLAKITKMI
ncbi:MAG: 16S rRNA (guanine(527)-N(7))-methyltransferase RsmG [Arenicella sp.]